MSEREPKIPKTQTSAPVSREEPRDVRDEKDRQRQADGGDGRPLREEDAAGGDRGLLD